jgi:hypothetical protein
MPDEIPVDVQASIAAADHAQLVGDHAGRRAAASAALKSWAASMNPVPSAEPKDAIGAAQRLEYLQKDAGWRDRYFRGEVQARQEFDALTQQVSGADDVELALAGHAVPGSLDENSGAVISEHDLPAAVHHLRDAGMAEHHIEEVARGTLLGDDFKPLAADEIDKRVINAERVLTLMGRDPELRRRVLSGDAAALEVLQRASATIALGKRGTP